MLFRAVLTEPVGDMPAGTPVGLKMVHSDPARFAKFAERSSDLAKLRLPGLARHIESFTGPSLSQNPYEVLDADQHYTVHLWVDGVSLDEAARGASVAQVVVWFRQIATAIDVLHTAEAGPFAHRDLHPRNVVIDDNHSAVLIDYDTILLGDALDTRIAATHAFAPASPRPGLVGAQADDRMSFARMLLHGLADDWHAGNQDVDAAIAARERTRDLFGDPTAVAEELLRISGGRDRESATEIMDRVESQGNSFWPRVGRRLRMMTSTRVLVPVVLVVLIVSTWGVFRLVDRSSTGDNEKPTSLEWTSRLTFSVTSPCLMQTVDLDRLATTFSPGGQWTATARTGSERGPRFDLGDLAGGTVPADGMVRWEWPCSAPDGSYFVRVTDQVTGRSTGTVLFSTRSLEDAERAESDSSSSTAVAPPAGTHWATSGGAANTWSDFSSAGGTQGQSVRPNETVEIECRVQGFVVPDGNTWWYRLAQSPWDGNYYASADAFYNNGQVAGSLVGTPFVDESIPLC
jgi:hypothetical protein